MKHCAAGVRGESAGVTIDARAAMIASFTAEDWHGITSLGVGNPRASNAIVMWCATEPERLAIDV
ncbi:hypothetical protein N7373_07340 [Achromobacter mucicolens]|uniref:hypothetical protein n=1 Tax=Achromobacter mucicolens TaxID=1389922 RepID=UPI002447228F|nr:hypothetical protein [Achromobacter mucicolens]MDH0091254.1 hypothetical protein [Achromobacter mucicolens]